MGSDLKEDGMDEKELYISIHAPVWGATEQEEWEEEFEYISIHAPVWGATR